VSAQLGECAPELFERGVPVLIMAGLASTAIEAQVVRWREEQKLPIDWHFVGGRAVVRVFPEDLARWKQALRFFSPKVILP
jgi:hypothetical protein